MLLSPTHCYCCTIICHLIAGFPGGCSVRLLPMKILVRISIIILPLWYWRWAEPHECTELKKHGFHWAHSRWLQGLLCGTEWRCLLQHGTSVMRLFHLARGLSIITKIDFDFTMIPWKTDLPSDRRWENWTLKRAIPCQRHAGQLGVSEKFSQILPIHSQCYAGVFLWNHWFV